jgi:hypothetical protein
MRVALDVELAPREGFHQRSERPYIGMFDVALVRSRVDGDAKRARLQHDSGTIQKVRRLHGAARVAQQGDAIYVTRKMRHAITEAHSDEHIVQHLSEQGFACVPPNALAALCSVPLASLRALEPTWNDLPRDQYLRDGGRYRARRHSSFVQTCGVGTKSAKNIALQPHRAHWQPTDYNALHGGIERWFEPLLPAVANDAAFHALLAHLGDVFLAVRGAPLPQDKWFIEAHQFRIDTAQGVGRPTPEGAHRDGVDFVAVILVQRGDMRGGESRVFEADGPNGVRFTLSAPWTTLLLDDAKVIHETTPILPGETAGVRDTLVLTYRSGGFMDPQP